MLLNVRKYVIVLRIFVKELDELDMLVPSALLSVHI
jgi:hypothetical protein